MTAIFLDKRHKVKLFAMHLRLRAPSYSTLRTSVFLVCCNQLAVWTLLLQRYAESTEYLFKTNFGYTHDFAQCKTNACP